MALLVYNAGPTIARRELTDTNPPPLITAAQIADARSVKWALPSPATTQGRSLVLVCVLKGSFVFAADLAARHRLCPCGSSFSACAATARARPPAASCRSPRFCKPDRGRRRPRRRRHRRHRSHHRAPARAPAHALTAQHQGVRAASQARAHGDARCPSTTSASPSRIASWSATASIAAEHYRNLPFIGVVDEPSDQQATRQVLEKMTARAPSRLVRLVRARARVQGARPRRRRARRRSRRSAQQGRDLRADVPDVRHACSSRPSAATKRESGSTAGVERRAHKGDTHAQARSKAALARRWRHRASPGARAVTGLLERIRGEPLFDGLLAALLGRLVEARAGELVGQVRLAGRDAALLEVVRVAVALAVALAPS